MAERRSNLDPSPELDNASVGKYKLIIMRSLPIFGNGPYYIWEEL